jgi:hypothetical protein
VTDGVGRTASTSRRLRVNDPPGAPRLYGVSVNMGALYTNTPDVTLTLVYPPSTTGVVMSNDGGFMTALALDPSPRIRWRLGSSGSERLPKTVYVRFLSGPFVTDSYTDDIVLDETPPTITSASLRASAPAANPVPAASAAATRLLRIRARDNASGVAGVQVAIGARASRARFRSYRGGPIAVSRRGRIWVRVRDGAGNVSTWKAVR